MANEPKREAQNALFVAIQSQAENNMKSALKATEKATLLRDLAEAYRLVAGGALPEVTTARRRAGGDADGASGGTSARRSQAQEGSEQEESHGDEERAEEERPRRRAARRRQSGR